MATIKKMDKKTNTESENVEKLGTLATAYGDKEWCGHFGKQLCTSLGKLKQKNRLHMAHEFHSRYTLKK